MIYLKVEHTNDDDVDLFCFANLSKAIDYINKENITQFDLSDIIFEEFPEGDYTFIEMMQ